MWGQLDRLITERATALIREHETYARWAFDENERRKRRTVSHLEPVSVYKPMEWSFGRGFNPYFVRTRSGCVAHAISIKLKQRTYDPPQPAGFKVPKKGGGERIVTTFQIADEAISNQLFRSLSRKNMSRVSSRAYAYQSTLSAHDAIAYVRGEFDRSHRLFIAEFDFTKYFDKVNHEHVLRSLDQLGIIRTPLEQFLIEAFLHAPMPRLTIEDKSGPTRRLQGLPQGTSISLFLANIAAAELDRLLEQLGVGFVRYADDTLVWSRDYGRICAAVDAIYEAAQSIGSDVHPEKSNGVRLLVKEGTKYAEMRKTENVDYLGHTLTLRATRMKQTAIDRVKEKVDQLIFNNLLREPLRESQAPSQLTTTDRDYVTYIWQLRRYIYGPLNENQIRRFHDGSVPPMSFAGLMSFFPLVNDGVQLTALDGWLAHQTWMAMQKRRRTLAARGLPTPLPMGLPLKALITYTTASSTTGAHIDLRLPSFRKIAKVIQTAIKSYGFGVASGGASLYLYD